MVFMDIKNIESINDALKRELVSTSFDLSVDFTEIPIDGFFKVGIAEEIPIVKTIIAIGKMGVAIRDIHFAKKTLNFLREFHEHSISNKKLEEFKQKMNSDTKYKNRVTEHLLVILDKIIVQKKSIYLARLFSAHINGVYNWDTFIDLTICLDGMQMVDFRVLKYFKINGELKMEEVIIPGVNQYVISASIERLESYGFVGIEENATWGSLLDSSKKKVNTTEFGNAFYNSCLAGD
jgi:hypothetical protein